MLYPLNFQELLCQFVHFLKKGGGVNLLNFCLAVGKRFFLYSTKNIYVLFHYNFQLNLFFKAVLRIVI